jgi:hypothetical protein
MATDFPANPSNGDTHAGFTFNSTTGAWESSAAGGSSGSGVTSHANVAAFPASPDEGDLAYAEDTDALYLRKSSTWERVYTGVDEILSFDNDPPASIQLNAGSNTTVNLPATDPEGFPITYSHDTNPSNQASATITNSGSTYTISPTTTAGNFTLRFKATDGLHSISKTSNVSLSLAFDLDYLVVAGGGGGGGNRGGGGGAGGLLSGTTTGLASGIVLGIVVGSGGTAGSGWGGGNGGRGGNSSITQTTGTGFTTVESTGGGGGANNGDDPWNSATYNGGSGGGASKMSNTTNTAGGKGIYPGSTFVDAPRQGYDGGARNGIGGAGGGGAGGVGGTSGSGAGGVGVESSITGTATYYAGGGGGGEYQSSNPGGAGGNGGGGAGGDGTGTAGTDGLGGGGGGGGDGNGTPGGVGGSGVVILRTTKTASSTTGSPTVTQDGSYNVYKFTADGTITF